MITLGLSDGIRASASEIAVDALQSEAVGAGRLGLARIGLASVELASGIWASGPFGVRGRGRPIWRRDSRLPDGRSEGSLLGMASTSL